MKMKVVIFFLLMSVVKTFPQEDHCCLFVVKFNPQQFYTPQCYSVLSGNACENFVVRQVANFSEAGSPPAAVLSNSSAFLVGIIPGIDIGSCVVGLKHSNLTSRFLNQIAAIRSINALFLAGESSILINDKNDCVFLSGIGHLHFDSVTTNFLTLCKGSFTSVAYFRVFNSSFPIINLPVLFPTLQSLGLLKTNITIPPQFPWYNLTKTQHSVVPYEQFFNLWSRNQFSVNRVTIPLRMFPRRYFLNFNPHIKLDKYNFSGFLHELSLVGCQLTDLKADIFIDVAGLQFLNLSINNLKSLPESIFTNLIDLRGLDIAFNMIKNLSSQLFAKLSQLVNLSLSDNNIERLDNGVFAKLINLEHVYLDNNFIRCVHKDAFDVNNFKMKYISLKNNPIEDFPHSLLYFPNLRNIDMQGHSISVLNFSEFFTDKELNNQIMRDLKYRNHSLSNRTVNMSKGATHLLSINSNIPAWKMVYILKFHYIFLHSNPLTCSCDIGTLLQFVKKLENEGEISGQQHAFVSWNCSEPHDLKGKYLLRLNPTDLHCPLNLTTCPDRCMCYERFTIYLIVVGCREANLTELPSVLPAGKIELLLTGNSIEHFKMSISQCASIVKLEIQGNRLKSLDSDCISSMKYLKVLYLNNNLLISIPNVIQKLEYLEEIQLENNPFLCDCNSLWFKHWLMKEKAIIKDYANVKCANFGDDTGHQIYNVPDKDFICKKVHSNTVTSVIASVASVAFICLLSMLLLYINWQRFKVCLYIHTGMHPFDKADDDDLMPYDALVVYVSESEWVNTNIITPLTEEHGYKLMDCEKDFKFGVDQDRNIQDGISESKRLLLVITPDSLSERLIRRTIEDALEKCKTQKVNFIIPIFHNCSPADCKDKQLNKFIKSGIFVSTLHHYFLRRILYYMPKKRLKQLGVHYKSEENSDVRLKVSNSLDELVQQRLQMKNTNSGDSCAIDSGPESNLTNRASSIIACSGDSIGITRPITSQHAVEIHYMSCPELIIERPSPEGSVVFVWYADEDFQFMMNEIVRPLEEYGHAFILADKSFIPGASNQENILNAIERSSRTIIILSKESIVDELLLYTFRFASERHMSDDHYMMGLIVRGDVDELDCDEEVKKHMLRFTPLSDKDEWFLGKLRAFVKQYYITNPKL